MLRLALILAVEDLAPIIYMYLTVYYLRVLAGRTVSLY